MHILCIDSCIFWEGGVPNSHQIYIRVFQDSNDDMVQKLIFNYTYSEGFHEDIYDGQMI